MMMKYDFSPAAIFSRKARREAKCAKDFAARNKLQADAALTK
jgi:hypothetical protein